MKSFTSDDIINEVKQYVRTCNICQRIKDRNLEKYESFNSKVCNRANENWMLDIVRPLQSK